MNRRFYFSAFSLIIFLGACSSRPPIESIARAQTSLNQAKLERADVFLPVEFKQAQDKMKTAEKAMMEFEYETAMLDADQCSAIADLARYKARLISSSGDLDRAQKDIDILRQTFFHNDPNAKRAPIESRMPQQREIGSAR